MSGVVVDASAVLAFCFEDERPADADATLDRWSREGALAPAHWPLEVTNILALAERRGRISTAETLRFVELVQALGVDVDAETARRAWGAIRDLAMAEGLTTYDAAYLELALRKGAALASKDAVLLAAARRRGAEVIDLEVRRA